jgi:hypothetical protein
MVSRGDRWADLVIIKGCENQALALPLPPGRASQLDPRMDATYKFLAVESREGRNMDFNNPD